MHLDTPLGSGLGELDTDCSDIVPRLDVIQELAPERLLVHSISADVIECTAVGCGLRVVLHCVEDGVTLCIGAVYAVRLLLANTHPWHLLEYAAGFGYPLVYDLTLVGIQNGMTLIITFESAIVFQFVLAFTVEELYLVVSRAGTLELESEHVEFHSVTIGLLVGLVIILATVVDVEDPGFLIRVDFARLVVGADIEVGGILVVHVEVFAVAIVTYTPVVVEVIVRSSLRSFGQVVQVAVASGCAEIRGCVALRYIALTVLGTTGSEPEVVVKRYVGVLTVDGINLEVGYLILVSAVVTIAPVLADGHRLAVAKHDLTLVLPVAGALGVVVGVSVTVDVVLLGDNQYLEVLRFLAVNLGVNFLGTQSVGIVLIDGPSVVAPVYGTGIGSALGIHAVIARKLGLHAVRLLEHLHITLESVFHTEAVYCQIGEVKLVAGADAL